MEQSAVDIKLKITQTGLFMMCRSVYRVIACIADSYILFMINYQYYT